jgi:primosomal protein N' (replication factor Y)
MKNLARNLRRKQTDTEQRLWRSLRNQSLGYKFRRQHIIDNKYIVDFICIEKMLIIELDGGQHCENGDDQKRTEYLEKIGFTVVRFWNNEIFQNLEGCLIHIEEALKD